MNYVKAQQEILAAVLADTPRPVAFYKIPGKGLTMFCHPSGFYAYAIPEEQVAVSLHRCYPLERSPFPICPAEDVYELTATGVMIEHERRTLLEFKSRDGVRCYFNKQLLAKFGKDVRLYSKGWRDVATVTDGDTTVGYLCPVKYKPENQ